jgi:hypothetical protein
MQRTGDNQAKQDDSAAEMSQQLAGRTCGAFFVVQTRLCCFLLRRKAGAQLLECCLVIPKGESVMSIAELMPKIQSLSRGDQLELMNYLADSLEKAEPSQDELFTQHLAAGASFQRFTPEFAPGAADILADLLKTDQSQS